MVEEQQPTFQGQVEASALPVLIRDHQAELTRLRGDLNGFLARAGKERAQLQADLETLRRERDAAAVEAREAEKLAGEARESRAALASLTREVAGREAARDQVKDEYTKLVEEVRGLTVQIEEAERHTAALRAEATMLEQQVEEHKANLAAAEVTLAGETQQAKTVLQRAQNEADLVAAERVRLESVAEAFREREDALEKREDAMGGQGETLEAKLAETNEVSKRLSQREQRIVQREQELDQLEELAKIEHDDAKAAAATAKEEAAAQATKAGGLAQQEAALQAREEQQKRHQEHLVGLAQQCEQAGRQAEAREAAFQAAVAELGRMHAEFRVQVLEAGGHPEEPPQFARLQAILQGEDLPPEPEPDEPERKKAPAKKKGK